MANHEPDKEMFDMVKEKMKALTDALTQWQQKESAIHSLAENSAKSAGAPPEQMDAHVYMHKKMIKKAMADQAKQAEAEAQQQGVPTAQDMPGGPTSTAPQGSQGTGGGSMTAGPGPLVGPPSGPTPGGQGGPGFNYGGNQPNPQLGNSGQGRSTGNPPGMVARNTPVLPMAGHSQNTGANGWEGLVRPTPYPGAAQVQKGAPTQSTGPITAAQHPLPGMPTPGVPGGFTGTNVKFGPYTGNTLPKASPPLTRPMR